MESDARRGRLQGFGIDMPHDGDDSGFVGGILDEIASRFEEELDPSSRLCLSEAAR